MNIGDCEHENIVDDACQDCPATFIVCQPCSESGGAGLAVRHTPPACRDTRKINVFITREDGCKWNCRGMSAEAGMAISVMFNLHTAGKPYTLSYDNEGTVETVEVPGLPARRKTS